MSGRSRTGQNCFGVATPMRSPQPPAGSTAATASAQAEEAEPGGSGPRALLRKGPGSAGPARPSTARSMAARGARQTGHRGSARRTGGRKATPAPATPPRLPGPSATGRPQACRRSSSRRRVLPRAVRVAEVSWDSVPLQHVEGKWLQVTVRDPELVCTSILQISLNSEASRFHWAKDRQMS